MSHRRNLVGIDAKDREFYQRIAKNRVDASLQSPTSPIPDYYGTSELWPDMMYWLTILSGEKIGSIHQYRQVRDSLIYTFEYGNNIIS